MDHFTKGIIWGQCGAAIDMLENAIRACPDDVWGDRTSKPEFWYTAYHTIFYIDFYMSESEGGFAPPAPFTLDELDPAGILPDRVYTKEEMVGYLEYSRGKCRERIALLTETSARARCTFGWLDISVAELVVYSARHIQHHAAQLNTLLRQRVDDAPRWVRRTAVPLNG